MNISQSNKEALKNPWVLGLIAFLLLFLSVNAVFIYYAFKSAPSLVDKNFYEDGENYQETQRRIQMQRALGWTGMIMLPAQPRVSQKQNYQVLLQGQHSADLQLDSIVLKAYRPSDASADFHVPMTKVKPGVYQAEMVFPLKGTWDLVLEARQGNIDFVISKRISIHP